ncbi:MAG TPA: aminoacyl-tRNA hydrolase [Vicinamibacterales bacterium]|nr:aminoacyl-tRNA hydrolase [Vicinamibacterales bacterium]
MKLVAGLGNPGRQYAGTRHNVGFEVVERLAARHAGAFEAAPIDAARQTRWRRGGTGDDVWLVEPLTFMNLSGEAIGGLARYYRIDPVDLLVICDDVALPLGRLRVRGEGSDGGHNGLKSVAAHLGTSAYPRLRVGVGRGDERRDLADHVLSRFEADERDRMASAVERAADAVEVWVESGLEPAMRTYNRWDASADADANNASGA